MKSIRVGIIGAGQNTRKMHIPLLHKIPGVEIVQVANRSLESSNRVALEFDIPAVKKDWQEIATSNEVDAIVIGTWPYLHCEASCMALEHGKHVLTEARMAMDSNQAKTMLKTGNRHPGLIKQIVPSPFTLRIDSTIQDFIENGNLGNPHYFEFDFQSTPSTRPGEPILWRRNKKYSGNNIMFLGIVFESILRWFGQADWVSAAAKTVFGQGLDPDSKKPCNIEVPDFLSVHLQLENGMSGRLRLSEASAYNEVPNLRIVGDKGVLDYEFKPDGSLWFTSHDGGTRALVEIPSSQQGFWRVEEEFINAIQGKEEIKHTPFELGVEYMRFTDAVNQSFQNEGKRIALADL